MVNLVQRLEQNLQKSVLLCELLHELCCVSVGMGSCVEGGGRGDGSHHGHDGGYLAEYVERNEDLLDFQAESKT